MPKYAYVVKDKESKTYKDVVEASSREMVVQKLQTEGYFILSLKEISPKTQFKTGFFLAKKKRFSYKKIKLTDLLSFARQLATMLEAGVTVIRALEVITAQTQSERFYYVIDRVKKDVEEGSALSLALSQHPKVFSQFWVSLAEVGEASGTIPVVFNKLASHLEQEANFRSTVVSSLIYPGILIGIATVAISVFALFVGPRFESVFKSLGVQLPVMTRVLLSTFRVIKENIILIFGGIAGGIFLLKRYLKTYSGQLLFEKIMFNFPKIGEVYKLIIIERFTSQMSILIDSGVPILYALDIVQRLVSNHTCALIVSQIKESVRQGEPMAQPMGKSDFFPPMAIQMINVGEETGELGKMLRQVSSFYQSNIETFLKRLSTVIEPMLIIFMGGVIGLIVISILFPLFNIAQLGGGSF